MKIVASLTAILLYSYASAISSNSYTPPTCASSDPITACAQIEDLIAHANTITRARASCPPDKIQVRRKWEVLSSEERIAYSSAMRCMQLLPAKSPPEWGPGVKSRFDDFVASHTVQALDVHFSGTFLGYHRWIIAEFERAMGEECGFTGVQPYWDWTLTAMTGMEASPLFDGSATSMGGNGEYTPDQGFLHYPQFEDAPGGPVIRPTGTGGGCVKSGPFSDYIVSMGPHLRPIPGGPGALDTPTKHPLDYNPRCLKRDLTDAINQEWVNATKIVNTIIRPQTNAAFLQVLQGKDTNTTFGIHGDGHIMVGGDPGGDIGGNSPAEPTFYMLHAAVDMYWWLWQTLDWDNRVFGDERLSGTITGLNEPPSEAVTFDTEMTLHFAARGVNVTTRDVNSVVDRALCYVSE